MNPRSARADALHAEPGLVELLGRIDGTTGRAAAARGAASPMGCGSREPIEPISQQRADALLARIAWSRLAEPGDGVAGALLAAIGAEAALELLVQGASAKRICEVAVQSGFEASEKLSKEALERWLPRLDRGATVSDIENASSSRMLVALPGDPYWPDALDDLGLHRPTMLWVRGDPALPARDSLGVVGARAATGYGSHITAEIVDGVCSAGLAIVSGAAYGIDAVAHRTALAVEAPTIAVLAGGADLPYPRAHQALLERIATSGAVCSEMVPGTAPTKWRFLQRNRLISALSRATLVTEAGVRSGSLNTAGHAAQLGRPIGAVPGPVTSAASAGCHKLIRDYAAVLVTNAREMLELLGVSDELVVFAEGEGETRDGAWERRVLDSLPLRGAREAHDIARRAGLGIEQVNGVLAELELLGRVRRRDSPGGAPREWGLVRRQ